MSTWYSLSSILISFIPFLLAWLVLFGHMEKVLKCNSINPFLFQQFINLLLLNQVECVCQWIGFKTHWQGIPTGIILLTRTVITQSTKPTIILLHETSTNHTLHDIFWFNTVIIHGNDLLSQIRTEMKLMTIFIVIAICLALSLFTLVLLTCLFLFTCNHLRCWCDLILSKHNLLFDRCKLLLMKGGWVRGGFDFRGLFMVRATGTVWFRTDLCPNLFWI